MKNSKKNSKDKGYHQTVQKSKGMSKVKEWSEFKGMRKGTAVVYGQQEVYTVYIYNIF